MIYILSRLILISLNENFIKQLFLNKIFIKMRLKLLIKRYMMNIMCVLIKCVRNIRESCF